MSTPGATGERRNAPPIRILICDDHAMVRSGLRMILEDEPGFQVVGEAEEGAKGLVQAHALRPDVVLADISMPPPDGIEVARLLRRDLPEIKTIILSMHEDGATVREAFAAGAVGYVVKRSGPDELVRAIQGVMAGEICLDRELSPKLLG